MLEFEEKIVRAESGNLVWPSPQDYNESIQNPQFAFSDQELGSAEPELNLIGLPKPASGNFASVYRLFSKDRDYAVRCFLSPLAGRKERYQAISSELAGLNLPFLVPFSFIEKGIKVGGLSYPIMKMDWVRGRGLLQYVEEHLFEPPVLRKLAADFKNLISELQKNGIAHGDLQHGNIMVEADGSIKLVDYDGVFVNALKGLHGNELGHRNYQHPQRSSSDFDSGIDNFSAWLIWSSIEVLAEDQTLWSKLNAGDECLLFRRQDLISPEHSRVFHILELHQSQRVRELARIVRHFLGMKPSEISNLEFKPDNLSGLPLLGAIIELQENHSQQIRCDAKKQNDSKAAKQAVVPVGFAGALQGRYTKFLSSKKEKKFFVFAAVVVFSVFTAVSLETGRHEFEKLDWQVQNLIKKDMDKASEKWRKTNDILEESSGGPAPQVLMREAQKLMLNRKYEEAKKYLAQILQASGELESKKTAKNLLVAQSWEKLGQCQFNLREDDYGTECFSEALRSYLLMHDANRVILCRKKLADAAFNSKQYRRALESYLACLVNSPRSHRKQYLRSALNAAFESHKTLPADEKSARDFYEIWFLLAAINDAELFRTLIQAIEVAALQEEKEGNTNEARLLFEIERDLAGNRDDLSEFEKTADRRYKELGGL